MFPHYHYAAGGYRLVLFRLDLQPPLPVLDHPIVADLALLLQAKHLIQIQFCFHRQMKIGWGVADTLRRWVETYEILRGHFYRGPMGTLSSRRNRRGAFLWRAQARYNAV